MKDACLERCLDLTVAQRVFLFLLAGVLAGVAVVFRLSFSFAVNSLLYFLGVVLVATFALFLFLYVLRDVDFWDVFLAESVGALVVSIGLLVLSLTALYRPLIVAGVIVTLLAVVTGCAVTARLLVETSDVSMVESVISVVIVKSLVVASYVAALVVALSSTAMQQGVPLQ